MSQLGAVPHPPTGTPAGAAPPTGAAGGPHRGSGRRLTTVRDNRDATAGRQGTRIVGSATGRLGAVEHSEVSA